MSQLFNRIKVSNTSRNTFDLSHHQVTTSDFGYLIPICYRDMVPNDDFTVTPKIFTRLSPLAVPCYGRITARVHSFFVPYRILYPFWDAFISQDPNNHTIPPYFPVSTLRQALQVDPQYGGTTILPRGTYGRLMSNLGLNPDIVANIGNDPSGLDSSDRISAFPFLAYYRIWLDYFMDSSLNDHPAMEAAFNSHIANGGSMAVYSQYLETRNVCYKKDYFTTAKLNPQDGNPSLVGVDIANNTMNPGLSTGQAGNLYQDGSGKVLQYVSPTPSGYNSKIGQFTVEALRAANSLQRYLERNNFVGTKIINRILAHFGIQPTAERLDMAEFIGGNSFPIEIRDVTSYTFDQTAGNGTDGLGNQAGKGVGINSPETVKYHAKEHGIFMTVMSILPDTGYYQGLSKMWTKGVFGDALDYFTPEFENLGYQEVLNKEVYVPDAQTMLSYQGYDPDGIFAFQPRYSEYKFQNDILAGDMTGQGIPPTVITPKPQMAAYYDSWHLFRKLRYDDTNPLALNNNFVELNNHNNDYDRIFQYTGNQFDHFFFNIECDVKATRPMIGFAEPSLENANDGDGRSINLPYGGTRL